MFNHHGPLTFLPGYLLEKLGNFGIAAHRVPIAVMQWLAMAAVYCSPLLRNRPGKIYFIAIGMSAMLVTLPFFQLYGNAYVYQTIAGIFLTVILAQHTLPALVGGGVHASAAGAAVGNFLIGCLPFLAVTYLPAAGLLFLCALRKVTIGKAVLYAGAGVAVNLAFLGWIGSFKGYWAFHFYLNAEIMPLFNSTQNLSLMFGNLLPFLPPYENLFRSQVAFAAAAGTAILLAHLEGTERPWRALLLLAALISLLLRGFAIQGAPFCYAAICLATLLLSMRDLSTRQHVAAMSLVGLCALRLASLLVLEPELPRRPESTTFSRLAKKITEPGDKVIAYSFQNHQYILAERFPASGNFFYLPWQERYNEAPKFGIRTHVCDDIKQARPKLMLINKWKVWGKFPWDSYAGCVQGVIDRDYRQLRTLPIYVRHDYYERALEALHHPGK